jgi:hypothetical protein
MSTHFLHIFTPGIYVCHRSVDLGICLVVWEHRSMKPTQQHLQATCTRSDALSRISGISDTKKRRLFHYVDSFRPWEVGGVRHRIGDRWSANRALMPTPTSFLTVLTCGCPAFESVSRRQVTVPVVRILRCEMCMVLERYRFGDRFLHVYVQHAHRIVLHAQNSA